jgi:hypothetical protein
MPVTYAAAVCHRIAFAVTIAKLQALLQVCPYILAERNN